MGKRSHLAGGKFTSSHTSVLPTAQEVCLFLNSLPEVTKITLGFITAFAGSRRSAVPAVKATQIDNAMRVTATDKSGAQEIWVYVTDFEIVSEKLKKFVKQNEWQWRK